MPILDEFTMALDLSGPATATGEMKRKAAVTKRSYTEPYLNAAHSQEDLLQGGDEIQDWIYLLEKTTWERHGPNPTFDYEDPQTGTRWKIPWAMATQKITYNEHEMAVNQSAHTVDYRAERYKKVIEMKRQQAYIDIVNRREEERWSSPDNNTQEAATPVGTRMPYSIPSLVCADWVNTLPPGFTTVMQISPVTFPNWQNQQMRPGATTGYTWGNTGTELGFFTSFLRMRQLTHFMPIPKFADYAEQEVSPTVIFCSHWGERLVDFVMRANQQAFYGFGNTVGKDAAYSRLQYYGIPIVALEQLNAAALYSNRADNDGTLGANATEAAADVTGPRFWWIDGYCVKPVAHQDLNLTPGRPIHPSAQPYSVVEIMKLMDNLYTSNRRNHGVMSPSVDITSIL